MRVIEYMLDTNIVSYAIRGNEKVLQRLIDLPPQRVCVSSITTGELLFGLAKRPEATRLAIAVHELLLRLVTLPWDESVCSVYGEQRAIMEASGKKMASLDMLIAAHALSIGVVLVTNDEAFAQVRGLATENWLAN
ncbi:MAG: type II toxin-antitoxin system VapC family toxin [Verrucomicrobiales bacterium]|nr:type II toxin-antitoxin system VapC family toxin [Verrucomicrobiales bacterium]